MKYLRLLIVSICVGVLLTSVSLFCASAVIAQEKEQTTQTTDGSKTDTTATGFPTGTTCKKTGTYRAGNKYLEVILVVAEGEEFPPFADGQKTTWYELTSSTRSTFDAVKVAPDSN